MGKTKRTTLRRQTLIITVIAIAFLVTIPALFIAPNSSTVFPLQPSPCTACLSGIIYGQIVDSSGNPIAGATATDSQLGGGVGTNVTGWYEFVNAQVGTHVITGSSGFFYNTNNVQVNLAQGQTSVIAPQIVLSRTLVQTLGIAAITGGVIAIAGIVVGIVAYTRKKPHSPTAQQRR
jgi:hypothetical protein